MLTLIFFIKNNTIDISNISLNKFLVKLSEKKKFILYGIFFCYLFSLMSSKVLERGLFGREKVVEGLELV